MRICDNGIYRDATLEEIAEREMEAAQQVTELDPNEAWKTEIEAALIELAAMMAGGA